MLLYFSQRSWNRTWVKENRHVYGLAQYKALYIPLEWHVRYSHHRENWPYICNITIAILKNISTYITHVLNYKLFEYLETNKISKSHYSIISNGTRSAEVHRIVTFGVTWGRKLIKFIYTSEVTSDEKISIPNFTKIIYKLSQEYTGYTEKSIP